MLRGEYMGIGWTLNSPRMMTMRNLLVDSDFTLKEIGEKMSLSEGTVKIYACRIYGLLKLRNGRISLMHQEIEMLRREVREGALK